MFQNFSPRQAAVAVWPSPLLLEEGRPCASVNTQLQYSSSRSPSASAPDAERVGLGRDGLVLRLRIGIRAPTPDENGESKPERCDEHLLHDETSLNAPALRAPGEPDESRGRASILSHVSLAFLAIRRVEWASLDIGQ